MTHISNAIESILCGFEQHNAERLFGMASQHDFDHDFDETFDDGAPLEDHCDDGFDD
jgi:hypothetical protein